MLEKSENVNLLEASWDNSHKSSRKTPQISVTSPGTSSLLTPTTSQDVCAAWKLPEWRPRGPRLLPALLLSAGGPWVAPFVGGDEGSGRRAYF